MTALVLAVLLSTPATCGAGQAEHGGKCWRLAPVLACAPGGIPCCRKGDRAAWTSGGALMCYAEVRR